MRAMNICHPDCSLFDSRHIGLVVMLDEQRRYSLPAASGPPPGPFVLSGDGESSGTDFAITAHSLCSDSAALRLVCCLRASLFACRLPLPLQLGHWLHRHRGGSRDDLYRSEQLCLHLSYHSTSG